MVRITPGLVVGLVTGLVGAGGGFLLVPALALLAGLPMPVAVGTSLVVIAMKSFAGLAGHLSSVHIDWRWRAVTAAAVIGALSAAACRDWSTPMRCEGLRLVCPGDGFGHPGRGDHPCVGRRRGPDPVAAAVYLLVPGRPLSGAATRRGRGTSARPRPERHREYPRG